VKTQQKLKAEIEKQVDRLQQAEKDRPTLLAQVAYLGSLGLMFVLPVVVGAYAGRWLDGRLEGYSLRWTLSLIVLGIILGAMNVYLYMKEN
jgi:ATP synthase protein I